MKYGIFQIVLIRDVLYMSLLFLEDFDLHSKILSNSFDNLDQRTCISYPKFISMTFLCHPAVFFLVFEGMAGSSGVGFDFKR